MLLDNFLRVDVQKFVWGEMIFFINILYSRENEWLLLGKYVLFMFVVEEKHYSIR